MTETKKTEAINVLLKEQREFPPPASFTQQAWVKDKGVYGEAARDPEAFWARFAEELLWEKSGNESLNGKCLTRSGFWAEKSM